MFHSPKTMLFYLFSCTWRILYNRYAILFILIEFKATRPGRMLLPHWKLLLRKRANIFFVYIVFFIMSNLEYLNIHSGLMYKNPDENRQMHAKYLPLFKISPIYAGKLPLSLISRIRAYLWKITRFFAKVGTSVVYVLVGSRGPRSVIKLKLPCA